MEKNERDTKRGMFDGPTKEEQRKAPEMFEADRASHGMSKKKEKRIAVVLAILVLAFIIVGIVSGVSWRRKGAWYTNPTNPPKETYTSGWGKKK